MIPSRRGPDEVLAQFAALTANAPRPSGELKPAKGLSVGRLVGAVASAAVLVSAGAIIITTLNRPGPATGQFETLPTHHETDIDRGGTDTGIAGADIVLNSGCIYLAYPDRRWLVVWPTGTTLDKSQEPAVVRGPTGDRIAAVGEIFSMRGASYPANQLHLLQPVLDSAIPAACQITEILLADPYVRALRPVPATWRVDPTSQVEPGGTAVSVLLREAECAQGNPPGNRLQTPLIEYRAESVVITLSVLEIGGTCRNLEYPVTVTLQEPIGNREIVDGSDGSTRWQPGIGVISPMPFVEIQECDGLELPAIEANDTVTVQTDVEAATMAIDIRGENGATRLLIRYTDQACIDHPILGPIISEELEV